MSTLDGNVEVEGTFPFEEGSERFILYLKRWKNAFFDKSRVLVRSEVMSKCRHKNNPVSAVTGVHVYLWDSHYFHCLTIAITCVKLVVVLLVICVYTVCVRTHTHTQVFIIFKSNYEKLFCATNLST